MPIEERQDEYNVLMYLFHNPGSVSICPDLNSDSLASDIKVICDNLFNQDCIRYIDEYNVEITQHGKEDFIKRSPDLTHWGLYDTKQGD